MTPNNDKDSLKESEVVTKISDRSALHDYKNHIDEIIGNTSASVNSKSVQSKPQETNIKSGDLHIKHGVGETVDIHAQESDHYVVDATNDTGQSIIENYWNSTDTTIHDLPNVAEGYQVPREHTGQDYMNMKESNSSLNDSEWHGNAEQGTFITNHCEANASSVNCINEEFDRLDDSLSAVNEWISQKEEQLGRETLLVILSNIKHGGKSKIDTARACLLDRVATKSYLVQNIQEAIDALNVLAQDEITPLDTKVFANRRIIENYVNLGNYSAAIAHSQILCALFPNNLDLHAELGTLFMYNGMLDKARNVFKYVIERDNTNGISLINLGCIDSYEITRKSSLSEIERVADLLTRGLNVTTIGLHEPRHYQHLYDILQRCGREEQALAYLENAVHYQILPSKYQLCSTHIPGIQSHFEWNNEQLNETQIMAFKVISSVIRNTGEIISSGLEMHAENEHLIKEGEIAILELYIDGNAFPACDNLNSSKLGELCDAVAPLVSNCRFCDAMLIRFKGNCSYWNGSSSINAKIRTAWTFTTNPSSTIYAESRSESVPLTPEGVTYDTSFVHHLMSSFHQQTEQPYVFCLLVDSWHPLLTDSLKEELNG